MRQMQRFLYKNESLKSNAISDIMGDRRGDIMFVIPEGFRGCALWRDEKGVRTWAQGCADLPNGRRNTPGTRFGTASAGKVFVAVGVLQLVEKGLLRLDSCIGDVLPMDWKAIDRNITVEQLLTHTSGIPD